MEIAPPTSSERYKELTGQLQKLHGELRGRNFSENPALIGDYLGELRVNCNLLFPFLNKYIDILNGLQVTTEAKRQAIYEEQLKAKKSPSAADTHARNMVRVDESKVKLVENYIQQIKNEYERYNGICMYLQSRMKEFNTERMMN